jgi:hypothetical protein
LIVYPVPTSFLASRPWFAGKASLEVHKAPCLARYDSTFSEGNKTTTHKISLTFSGLFLVTPGFDEIRSECREILYVGKELKINVVKFLGYYNDSDDEIPR